MGIYTGDTIATPQGRSTVTSITRKGANQHRYTMVYAFANGLRGEVKKTRKEYSDPGFNPVGAMVFTGPNSERI